MSAIVPEGLKRTHLIMMIVAAMISAILVPMLTLEGSYHQAKAEIQQRISDVQLQNAQTFATKSDVKAMSDKLDKIAADTSEIKGYMYRSSDKK